MRHEALLRSQNGGFSSDIASTEPFKLLKANPEARLIIYCKVGYSPRTTVQVLISNEQFMGFVYQQRSPRASQLTCCSQNAGHIAQALRTDAYHTLTDTSDYHILTIDYRGFGKSTGTPSENGLIRDGVATVKWAMETAGVPSSRIVIMGQSLGTAVTSAVAEHFSVQGVEFAGVILIAGFSDMPTLLTTYMGAGFIPILRPLRAIPPVLRFFHRRIVDKWRSAERLAHVVSTTQGRLRLTLIHAKNDLEIPCHESDTLFRFAASAAAGESLQGNFDTWKEERTQRKDDGSFVSIVTTKPDITIRQELVRHGGKPQLLYPDRRAPPPLSPPPYQPLINSDGLTLSIGHNGIMLSSQVALAVLQSFESEAEQPPIQPPPETP